MRTFDISPLLRSSIGYENLNRLVEFAARGDNGDSGFPPYNIEKVSDGAYRIAMAVAGFAAHELDLTVDLRVAAASGESERVLVSAADVGAGDLAAEAVRIGKRELEEGRACPATASLRHDPREDESATDR